MEPLLQTAVVVAAVLIALFLSASVLSSSLFSLLFFMVSWEKAGGLSELLSKYEKGIKRFFYGVFLFLGALFIFSYMDFAFADVVLSQLLLFLPKAFVALLVLYFGYIAFSLVEEFVRSGVEEFLGYGVLPMVVGNAVGAIALALFLSISLDIVGLDSDIIKIFLVTLLLSVAVPLAVLLSAGASFLGKAMGVGYTLRFLGLKEGKEVKFGKMKGKIETISPTHIRLKTKKGVAVVMSKSFLERGWEEL